jgi:hypothetical protein
LESDSRFLVEDSILLALPQKLQKLDSSGLDCRIRPSTSSEVCVRWRRGRPTIDFSLSTGLGNGKPGRPHSLTHSKGGGQKRQVSLEGASQAGGKGRRPKASYSSRSQDHTVGPAANHGEQREPRIDEKQTSLLGFDLKTI